MEEQVYIELINEYGAALNEADKRRAHELFEQYMRKYNSFECLYWSLWKIGDRGLLNNAGLFLCDSLHNEIVDIVENHSDYLEYDCYSMIDEMTYFGFQNSKEGKDIDKKINDYISERAKIDIAKAFVKYYLDGQLKI